MFKILSVLVFLFTLFFVSCTGKKNVPNTDIDVSRAFVKNILEDNFDEAKAFILPDSLNIEYFNLFSKQYHSKSNAELENYKDADIVINEVSNPSDSVTIINYSNSFKKNYKNIIKAVKVNGKWLVDFKYTFSGNL